MSTINPTLHIPYYTSDAPVVRYTGSIDSGVVYTDTNNNIQGGKLTFTDDYFNIVNGNSNRTSIVCVDNNNNKVFNSFELPTSTLQALHTGSVTLTKDSVGDKYHATVDLVEYSMTITGISYNNTNNNYTINYTLSKGVNITPTSGHFTGPTDDNSISFPVIFDATNRTMVTISNIRQDNSTYYFNMTVNNIYKSNCTLNQQYYFYNNSYYISELSYSSTTQKYTFNIQYNFGETFEQEGYTNKENIVVNNTLISLDFTNDSNNKPSSVTIILYKTGQATTTISYTLQYNPTTNEYSWLNMDNINASNYVTKSFDTKNLPDNTVSITSNNIYVVAGDITSIQFIDNTLNYNVNKKYIALLDIDVIYNDITVMSDLVKSSNYLFLTFNTNSQGKINNTGTGTYDNIISDYKSLEKYTENITTTTSKVFHVSKVITDLYFNDYPCYFYISLFQFNKKIYEITLIDNDNFNTFFKTENNTSENYTPVSLSNTNTFSQNIRLVGSVTIMEYIK